MNPLLVPLKICPVAPTGVAAYTDQISGMVPVSYTHLTLPTNREV